MKKVTDKELRNHWYSYLDKRGINRPKTKKLKDLAFVVHKAMYDEEYKFTTSKYVRKFLTRKLKERRRQQKETESKIPDELIYFLGNKDIKRVKIGKTTDILSRLSALQIGSPFTLKVFGYLTDVDYHSKEIELHNKFSQHRIHGEWFELSNEIQEYIEKECSTLF